MDDVQKQMALGAIRTLLGVAGGVVVAHGLLSSAATTDIIGALMILVPLVWSALDKHWQEQKTQVREATAVNAGITLSNISSEVTQPVTAQQAQQVIQTFGDKK